MAYNSILLHLEVDNYAEAKIRYAKELADELDAYLIGFAACCVRPVYPTDGWMPIDDSAGLITEQNRKSLAEIQEMFLAIAGDAPNRIWRQSEVQPIDALLANARAADLIISATPHGALTGDAFRSVNCGDLVSAAGRPVMFLPENVTYRYPKKIVIGWKDTTQARRAVADALPLLTLASEVVVAAATESDDEHPGDALADVVAFLMRHGIRARHFVLEGKNGPEDFQGFVEGENADIVVTGAFSHSRMREWVFGGMTRSLLNNNRLNRLMSG